jgi:hypothetical protein
VKIQSFQQQLSKVNSKHLSEFCFINFKISGAARAFGLKTLLPLNVPKGQPLMYCPDKNLQQAKIQLDGKLYSCLDSTLQVDCIPTNKMSTELTTEETVEGDDCVNKSSTCNESFENIDEFLFCDSGVFASSFPVVCDSSTFSIEDDESTLNCYYGQLPEDLTSFIPTTEDPNEDEMPQKTFVNPSPIHRVVSFFVDLFVSKEKVSEVEIVTEPPVVYTFENTTEWLPSAFAVEV